MRTSEDRTRELTAEYRANYTRGWRSSLRAEGSGVLDAADSRGEPDAWYDGYFDAGAGREKWHLPNCAAHGNEPGDCMAA